jgi:hypothetical protein
MVSNSMFLFMFFTLVWVLPYTLVVVVVRNYACRLFHERLRVRASEHAYV